MRVKKKKSPGLLLTISLLVPFAEGATLAIVMGLIIAKKTFQ